MTLRPWRPSPLLLLGWDTEVTHPGYPGHPPNPACLWTGRSQLLPAPACTPNPGIRCPEDLRRGTPRYALDERLRSRVPSAESIQKNMFRFQLNFSNVSAATSKHQKTQTYTHFRFETHTVILAFSGQVFVSRSAFMKYLLSADPVACRPSAWLL